MGKTKVNGEPTRRRPQHSDEKLLAAACAVFARDGFAGATVDAIAASCGATKPTLYARFGSKADLYRATIVHERDVFLTRLFAAYAAAEDLPVEEIVERAVFAWFDFADRNPDGFRLLLAAVPEAPAADLIEEMRTAVVARVTGLIEGAMGRLGQQHPDTAGLVAAMIVGACIDGARYLQGDPGMTPARAAKVGTAFVVGAVWRLNRPLLDV